MSVSQSNTGDMSKFFSSSKKSSSYSSLIPSRTPQLRRIGPTSAKKETNIDEEKQLSQKQFPQFSKQTLCQTPREIPSHTLQAAPSDNELKQAKLTQQILEEIPNNAEVNQGLDRLLRMVQRQKGLMSLALSQGELDRQKFEKAKVQQSVMELKQSRESRSATKKQYQEFEEKQILDEEVQELREEKEKLLEEINEIMQLKSLLLMERSCSYDQKNKQLQNELIFDHVNRNCEIISKNEDEVIFKWKMNHKRQLDSINDDETSDLYRNMMNLGELNTPDSNKVLQNLDFESPVLAYSQDINCRLNTNIIDVDKFQHEVRINSEFIDQECSTCEDEISVKLFGQQKESSKFSKREFEFQSDNSIAS